MLKDFDLKKKELIEKLGVHIEANDHYAPLAARIVAFIILNGRKGATFEQLVTNLCASKSTVSTHLTHLQSLKKILYYTKTGDRKKYFVVNKDHLVQNMDNMIATWTSQKILHEEIKEFKDSYNQLETTDDESKFDLEFHTDFITFLNEATASISILRKKLIEKHHI
ncbi:GbsR/MarR family transcriptional regulator [Lutibacter maritimus]|uniref:DNA-binding transcriptional regulator GbsR, MarR family n=1 Tax=Lutibacter maritimus TaxID=593133 RepID=A0A1I6P3W6_9FLAO|nr:transcriptional regulator [Lutibacter maritimus]SFS34882.1 hypothetical protein SAMN04488006_0871 [Lutibacter maritimus]